MKSVTDECPDITHVYTIGRSYMGLKLYVMVISDNPSKHELGMKVLLWAAGPEVPAIVEWIQLLSTHTYKHFLPPYETSYFTWTCLWAKKRGAAFTFLTGLLD